MIRVRQSLTLPWRQERELNCGPGAGGARDLAEAPTKVAQTEWDEWDERVECDRIKAIKVNKPNQAKSR